MKDNIALIDSSSMSSIYVFSNYPLKFQQEIFPSAKYKFKNEEDSYQLIILGPKVEDTGKYSIEINGITSTGFLNVEGIVSTISFARDNSFSLYNIKFVRLFTLQAIHYCIK